MSIESTTHEHPANGGPYEGGDPAVNQVGDFIARHPAESMAMAAAAGVLTGIALETAPKAAAKAITTAIVGTAAVGFVSAPRGLGDDPRDVLTIDRVRNTHYRVMGRRGEGRGGVRIAS